MKKRAPTDMLRGLSMSCVCVPCARRSVDCTAVVCWSLVLLSSVSGLESSLKSSDREPTNT